MRSKIILWTIIFLSYLIVLAQEDGLAGGFFIPHQTSRGVALSSALTAGVDDPSAVYYNPAALGEIHGNQALLTGSYINVINSVENSGRTAVNLHDDNFTGSLFGNYHVPGTDFTLGLGLYSPFGLATSYRRGFTRFAARDTELKTYYLTPALSWHPSQFFSIGGGFSYIHSSALFSRSLCFDPIFGCTGPTLFPREEKIRIRDSDDAYSYNVGVLVKPVEAVKIGFSYRGRAALNFDHADTKLNGDFGPNKSTANVGAIPLPSVIDLGLFWQINPSWGAEMVYEYQHWSEVKTLKAKFSPPPFGISSFTLPQDWRNTNTLRLGSFYGLSKEWELRAGLVLEQGPVPNKTLSPAIPGADLLALSTGLGYKWDKFSVDLGYQAVFYKTGKVSNSELEGGSAPGFPFAGALGKDKYQTFNNFVSVSLGYRF